VWWEEEGRWFYGVVDEYDALDDKYLVYYDDGDCQKEEYVYLVPADYYPNGKRVIVDE